MRARLVLPAPCAQATAAALSEPGECFATHAPQIHEIECVLRDVLVLWYFELHMVSLCLSPACRGGTLSLLTIYCVAWHALRHVSPGSMTPPLPQRHFPRPPRLRIRCAAAPVGPTRLPSQHCALLGTVRLLGGAQMGLVDTALATMLLHCFLSVKSHLTCRIVPSHTRHMKPLTTSSSRSAALSRPLLFSRIPLQMLSHSSLSTLARCAAPQIQSKPWVLEWTSVLLEVSNAQSCHAHTTPLIPRNSD